MKALVKPHALPVYESGFLNYALSCLLEQGDFDKYAEWLKTEPVCTFTNTEHWTKTNDTLVYQDEEDKQVHEITLTLEINGEFIYHSLGAGNSFFFRELAEGKVEALYVD